MNRLNQKNRNSRLLLGKVQNDAFALVVILAFVVLLTVLVVAYFSFSAQQRQISNASSNQATAEIFAHGALAIIQSDLMQEIADGSNATTFGDQTVFIPNSNINSVPERVGAGSEQPNLLKRSVRDLPFHASGQSRASSVPSTSPSRNGRYITSARWNAPMLLAKADPSSTDLTPSDFTVPDWIYLDREGNNPTSWSNSLRWDNNTGTVSSVIGRFAYTIYDEGGLLDANVAGFPPGASKSLSGNKSTLASVDLTQTGLREESVAALVGWRNAATSQPGGNFPAFTFSPSSQEAYFKAMNRNPRGFMRTSNTDMPGDESDRLFVSRQQFLRFLETLADANLQSEASIQNSAQYLGTFSRALDQPSFIPHPDRPRIIGNTPPPPATQVDSYVGNSDAVGGDDQINPAILAIRVQGGFTRWDGSQAQVGEPLVKKRFALERLAYLTRDGPSSTASLPVQSELIDAGIPQEVIDAGTAGNIQKCFGLTWDAGSKSWTYQHGGNSIRTLSQVASAHREPDFFELLKASIHAGSLAKAGPNLHNNQDNYQYVLDSSLDYQVLQIGANLIDQFDSDAFPTLINISTGSFLRTFRGVEDIPYFYRYHQFAVVTELPDPLLSQSESVSFPPGTPGYSGIGNYIFLGARAGTLNRPGAASLFYIPEVWNPHDALGATTTTGERPDRFRVVAVTQDPAGQLLPWEIGTRSLLRNFYTNGQGLVPRENYPSSTPPTAPLDGALEFRDADGTLFREPTLLWRPGIPAGVDLAGNATATDANTSKTYTGILIGTNPVSLQRNIGGTSYIFQGHGLGTAENRPAGSSLPQITFRLQYWNGSAWATYDEKYPDLHVPGEPTMIVNRADFPNDAWRNPLINGGPFVKTATSYDPRTARFGVGTANDIGTDSPFGPTVEVNSYDNLAMGNSNFTIIETQRPRADRGSMVRYSNPGMTSDPGKSRQMRFFAGIGLSASNGNDTGPLQYDGLWSQNDPAIRIQNRANNGLVEFYYEDADGVARRAMGAYATKSLTPAASRIGLPLATANTYGANPGIGAPTAQSQSRPLILNRPFRSVGEMSYAFRGALWKQIDFFTPESGDAALLDAFCITEPPQDALVAGKVNLNTRQPVVLQSILSGAQREELSRLPISLPSGTVSNALTDDECAKIAERLVAITSETENPFQGPLTNVSELVGRIVSDPAGTPPETEGITYTSPASNESFTFVGPSAALDSSLLGGTAEATIQRLRESVIRPLAATGQVRVWNLMIDVVAQTGRFPAGSNALDEFLVEGEKRIWMHLAIDRLTGDVLDYQIELVSE